jgi:hypothetical protein
MPGARMTRSLRVALDSNAMTYLIRALESHFAQPSGPTAPEEIALCRLYIYCGLPYASPTVVKQCLAIRDDGKRETHDNWLSVAVRRFGDDLDMSGSESRILDLFQLHRDPEDCTILVECERYGMDVLLTCDRDFIDHLAGRAQGLRVLRPSELWAELGIPAGALPRWRPASGNPIKAAVWWRI